MPLDIGVGILLSLGVAEFSGIPVTPTLILFGIAAALLPDIDIITVLFGKWKHRTHTHYPTVYIPIVLIVYILLGPVWALLLALGVYAHFVHDTIGIGWGIAWLWPFSHRKFLIFPEKARRASMGTVASWLPEEEAAFTTEGTGGNWVREFYFRPNPLAYIEYGVLPLSLIILFLYIQ